MHSSGLSVGGGVLYPTEVRVQTSQRATVDDQIAREAIDVRVEDGQVVRLGCRVVNLDKQIARQYLLNAEVPCHHLRHLVVRADAAEAPALQDATDVERASLRIDGGVGGRQHRTRNREGAGWLAQLEGDLISRLHVKRREEVVRQVGRGHIRDVQIWRLVREHAETASDRGLAFAEDIPGESQAWSESPGTVVEHFGSDWTEADGAIRDLAKQPRSEEHTSELQSLRHLV